METSRLTKPFFSIIVPVFNKAAYLKRCIDSVIHQSFTDWELLLLDDGSSDDSLPISQDFADTRITVYHHENHGVSFTRNRGIQEAEGTFVVFLDADDYWGPNFLIALAEVSRKRPYDIILTGITKIETDGSRQVLLFPYEGPIPSVKAKESFFEVQRETQLYGYVANKALRKAFLKENHLFFNERLNLAEDLDFFLRCYERCSTLFFIKNADYYYVKYEKGTSMYRRDIDFLSLINIQRHLKSYCDGFLSEDDDCYYKNLISGFCLSALEDVPYKRIPYLNKTVQIIKNDPELRSLCMIDLPIWQLKARAFIKQIRMDTFRVVSKIWKR